jgi:hypothetical protein
VLFKFILREIDRNDVTLKRHTTIQIIFTVMQRKLIIEEFRLPGTAAD